MSEQIGKHKGAVETLMHEKKELSRILQIVNSQIQRHLSALEEAGIDTDEFIENLQEGNEQKKQGSQQQQRQKKSGQNNRRQSRDQQNSQRQNKKEKDDDTDPNELLEGEEENSFDDRDFNPNR